jgi:hypothetical protein
MVSLLAKTSQFSGETSLGRFAKSGCIDVTGISVQSMMHMLIFGLTMTTWMCLLKSRLTEQFERDPVNPLENDLRPSTGHCTVCASKPRCRDGQRSKARFKSDACVICILDFEDSDELRVLCCGHPFHRECIKGWFKMNVTKGSFPSCPICRTPVCLDEWPLGAPIEGPRVPQWIFED